MGFDDFDWKGAAKTYGKPAIKVIAGVVGAAYGNPAGAGQASEGIGEIVDAAGGNDEKKPGPQKLEQFDQSPKVKPGGMEPPPPAKRAAPTGEPVSPESDRERVRNLLLSRGWSAEEADGILDGPKSGPGAAPVQRVKRQPVQRVPTNDATSVPKATAVDLARPARLVTPADASTIKE